MTERTATVRLRAVITDFQAAYARAGTSVKGLQKEIQTGAAANKAGMEKVSRGALLLGGAALAGVGMAVKAFADFDHQMSAVHAATQANVVEMGHLRDAAIEAGQQTVFSATEAAQAETELAKAGLSAADITGGALKGALSLASAGSLEVAASAEIAATAMTQFGLSGKDVPHIADLLAAGAGKAQGEVTDLAEALKFVGPVAHGMGITIEETVGTLAEFASKGIIGEQAGTGLRGMLLSLTSPSKQAAAEMARLGINMYDANGQMVGFNGMAGQLRTAMVNLTPAQRDLAFGVLFGNQQVTAARVLYEGGATAVDKWHKSVDDAGYATKVAADKMDNLTGDLNNLQSSLETALIKSGSSANTTLRFLTKTATGSVNTFASLPGPLQATAVGFVAVAGAVLLTGGAIGFLGPKIAATRLTLEGLGPAGVKASAGIGLLGKATLVGTVVIGVGMAVSALSKELIKLSGNAPPAADALTRSLVKFADSGQLAGTAAKTFGSDTAQLTDDIHMLNSTAGDIHKWSAKTSFGLIGASFTEAKDRVEALDKALAGLVEGGHGDVAAAIFSQLSEQVKASGGDVDQFKAALDGYSNAVANSKTQTRLAGGEQKKLAPAISDAAKAATEAATAVKDYSKELDGLNSKSISVYENQTALRRSFHDLAGATKKAGKVTLDERDALSGFADQAVKTAQAIVDQTGDTDKANGVLRTSRKRFLDAAEAAGYTAKQAKKLADRFFAIPTAVSTKVRAPGLDDAVAKVADLAWKLNHIPKSVTFGVFGKVAAGSAGDKPARAGGGPVQAGRTYLVGEEGSEWFTPKADGFITAHGAFNRPGTQAFGNLAGTSSTPGKPSPLAQPKVVTGGEQAQDRGDGFGMVTRKARAALLAVQAFQDALGDTAAIDAYTANANLAKSYHDLAKQMKDAGKVTNDEKIGLGGFAADVKSTAAAVYELTKSQSKANAAMRKGRREFIGLAMDAGYSRKQAKALANQLGLTGRAGGGPVAAGTAYRVGESGAELFTPTTPGYITSNGALTRATTGGGGQSGRLHRDDLAALARLIATRPDTVITLDRRVLARAVDAQNHDDRLLL